MRLPRPSEIRDFVAFVAIETDAERGIMTAEHQSGAGFKAVCKMLPSLAKKRLSALSATISAAPGTRRRPSMRCCRSTRSDRFLPGRSSATSSSVAAVEPDALPARVIKDSQTNYAIFGPGARKGAYLMDGGEAAYDVLNDDQDINQEEALARARAIVKDFPAALRRIGLEEEWKAVAGGRVRPRGGGAQPLRLLRRRPRPHPRGGRRGRHSRACQGQFPLREQQRARGRLAPQPVHGPRAQGAMARDPQGGPPPEQPPPATAPAAEQRARAPAAARALSDGAPAADGGFHRGPVDVPLRNAHGPPILGRLDCPCSHSW